MLKNASGAIKRKVNEIFSNTLRDFEKKELCTLIYYPEQKLELVSSKEPDLDDWYLITFEPTGAGMPQCIFQIYPFEGAQGPAEGVLLYHPGVVA